MGLISDFNIWRVKRRIKRHLRHCDFEKVARDFRNGKRIEEFPKEKAEVFNLFINNPCMETALRLIFYDYRFFDMFYLSTFLPHLRKIR